MDPPVTRLRFGNLVSPETIDLNLQGSQREGVLEELTRKIPALADAPEARHQLLRALIEREKLHSTGVGDGVALPHARNALVGLVSHPVVVFGRHPRGVAFDAIDQQPARLFFLIVAPNVSQHLQLLARLSRLVRDPRLRQSLLVVERPAAVVQLLEEAESRDAL